MFGNRGKDRRILNCGTRWNWLISFALQPNSSREENLQHLLNWRLGVPEESKKCSTHVNAMGLYQNPQASHILNIPQAMVLPYSKVKLCQNIQKITEAHTAIQQFICCALPDKSWLKQIVSQDLPLGFTHVDHKMQLTAMPLYYLQRNPKYNNSCKLTHYIKRTRQISYLSFHVVFLQEFTQQLHSRHWRRPSPSRSQASAQLCFMYCMQLCEVFVGQCWQESVHLCISAFPDLMGYSNGLSFGESQQNEFGWYDVRRLGW
jgi:hypothetical protein